MPEVIVIVDMRASPEAVVALVGAFDLLADFHPQVASCEVEGDGVGATRVLWLGDGQEIRERLLEETSHGYAYESVRASLNFQSWRARIEIVPEGEGTRVTWSLDFVPTEDADVEAAVAQQHGIFEEGLDSAKRQLEGLD